MININGKISDEIASMKLPNVFSTGSFLRTLQRQRNWTLSESGFIKLFQLHKEGQGFSLNKENHNNTYASLRWINDSWTLLTSAITVSQLLIYKITLVFSLPFIFGLPVLILVVLAVFSGSSKSSCMQRTGVNMTPSKKDHHHTDKETSVLEYC